MKYMFNFNTYHWIYQASQKKKKNPKYLSTLLYDQQRLCQLSLHQAWQVEGARIATPNCSAHDRHG